MKDIIIAGLIFMRVAILIGLGGLVWAFFTNVETQKSMRGLKLWVIALIIYTVTEGLFSQYANSL